MARGGHVSRRFDVGPERRRIPANARPSSGPRTPLGRLERSIADLIDRARRGEDMARPRRAVVQRVRRLLAAARRDAVHAERGRVAATRDGLIGG